MGRPRPPDTAATEGDVPEWVHTYVQADWTRPEDDTCSIAVENNSPEFGRIIMAHGRWSDARRAWLAERGLTSHDIGARGNA